MRNTSVGISKSRASRNQLRPLSESGDHMRQVEAYHGEQHSSDSDGPQHYHGDHGGALTVGTAHGAPPSAPFIAASRFSR